jgi:tetratricopeptide (TPR) repeat protein
MMDAVQRGMAAFRVRKFQEAAGCFQTALDADPDDIAVRSFLGQALCHLGRRFEGLGHLRTAARDLLDIAHDDGDIVHALDVIQLLEQFDDYPNALELGREAAAIAPQDARVHQQVAVAASMTNRRDEAVLSCAEALRRTPEDPMLKVLMSSLLADAGRLHEALDGLQALIASDPPARAAFRAHKEAARVLDKLGRFDRVFSHLHASARLGPDLPEYSSQPASALTGMIAANRAGFDRTSMGRWSATAFAAESPPPVFLVGFFRSGTTLTQSVLDAHPGVFVADEVPLVWAVQRELHRLDPLPGDTAAKLRRLDAAGIGRLRAYYWQQVHDRFGNAVDNRVLVDKFTMNTIDLGLMNTVFPDSKVVFVMRDPRDVCLSCFMQLMAPSVATARLLTWRGTAEFYSEVMAWWTHIRPALTLRWLEFRYEDAIADFEATFRRVFDFLGLPWDAAVADFHTRAAGKVVASPSRQQVTQPLYASSVARWRQYGAEFSSVDDLLRPWVAAYQHRGH